MIVGVFPHGAAFAQPHVDSTTGRSIAELVARALERAPDILAARAEIDAARGQLQQARLRPNPTLTAGRREEPAGSDNQTSVILQVPLDLFRRAGRVGTASETLAAVQLNVADRERLLASAVRERAGMLLLADRLRVVTDELLSLNSQTHALLSSRVAEGAAPAIERDLVDVEVRRLEAEHTRRVAEADTAMIALKAVLGLDPSVAITLRADLEQQVAVDRARVFAVDPQLLESVAVERADVREAAARIRAAEARTEQLRREGRFDLSVYGGYMRMDSGFPQRGVIDGGALERIRGVFHYAEVGGMVMLPVFNRNQGAIVAAEAERRAATLSQQSRELMARAEIAAAVIRDRQALSAVDTYAAARALARRNLGVVRESYELGRNTLFDVFSEQRRFLDVETAYAEALATAFDARTALLRATGERP